MNNMIANIRTQLQKLKCRIANLTKRVAYIEDNCCNGGGGGDMPDVSATERGVVNNEPLQELGGVDKLINGVRIGRGSGNNEDNLIVGKDALSTNTTGTYNTAFGGWALTENTTGSFNSSFGSGALYSNTTGIYNNAFGTSTLQNNTTGSRNVGVGTSLFWNSTGQENTGVGFNAGYGATTGSQNTYIGNQAGYNNGIGSYNTAIGSRAMITSGTGIPASTLDMNRNVFIGAGLTLADGVNDVLAIDNKGATNTFYSNALLYGNFADRFLRINGRFEIDPATMPTADIDFTKKLVYNPTDGKVTAVDDTSGGGIQSIVPGDNISVDNTDPQNPVISSTGTEGKAYPNLTAAMTVTPLPDNGVIFTIDEDNETEAGVYAYDSNEVNGYRFVREIGAKGKIEEGNTQAVSGGEVYEKLQKTKISQWTAKVYTTGEQVINDGNIYQASTAVLATDVPEVSDKWDKIVRGFDGIEMRNAISNGDFKEPITNWSSNQYVIVSQVDGNMRVVGSSTTGANVISNLLNPTFIDGNKYFIKLKIKATSTLNRIEIGSTTDILTIQNPIPDVWYNVSAVFTGLNFRITARFQNSAAAIGNGFEVNGESGMVLIDLTKTFGEGLEPTKEEIDSLLDAVPNRYFDGILDAEYYERHFLQGMKRYDDDKERATLKNAVLNPNFVEGAKNWGTFRAAIITDATHLTVRKVGADNFATIRQELFNLNHLYYVQFKVRVTSDNCTSFQFGFNGDLSTIRLPIKDKWYEVQEVVEVVRPENTSFEIRAYYPSEAEALDKEFEIDKEWGVVLIDLTDYFGAGNEPTAEQMVYLANSLPENRIGNSLYLENKFFQLRDNTPQKLETLSSLFQQLLSVQDNLTEELSWERVKTYFEPAEEYKNRFGDYPDPLVFYDGTPVADASDWELRKSEIRNKWMGIIGEWPELITDQEFTIISTVDRGDYIEHKVSFEWLPGELTEGYLLVPCGCNGELLPASISVYYDAETSAGLGGEEGIRDFSVQLVRKGFISLAIGAGFNYYNNWRYPNSTTPTIQPLSLRAYAAANAWHALANYQNVDSTRIGIVGHSYGGKWAQFASCLFDKFALGVWSDGGVVLEASDYEIPYYLGLSTPDYPDGAYNFLLSEGHDFSELHALMDGRPFLVSAGGADRENRWLSLNYNVAANEFLGRDKSIALTMREGHPPTHESNKELVNFFEHYLKFKGK